MLPRRAIFLVSIAMLVGCVTTGIPPDALILTPSSLQDRQLQTRIYEDVSEAQILSASVGIIQDLGASITETETDLGLVVGEKMRDATDDGQIAGAILVAVFLGGPAVWDEKQKIRFSLVTTPASNKPDNRRWVVRLTIQRIVWNNQNQVNRIEAVKDAEIFQGFFEKLDKSLFLEKQL
jgi:hypothetical protein